MRAAIKWRALACLLGWGLTLGVIALAGSSALAGWEIALLTLAPWVGLVLFEQALAVRARAPTAPLSVLDFTQRLTVERHAPGDVILEEGAPADAFYILSTGRVQVFRGDDYGARIDVAELHTGSFFGEMGLLSGAPRNASVEALTEVTVLVMGRELFEAVMGRSGASRDHLERAAAERAR